MKKDRKLLLLFPLLLLLLSGCGKHTVTFDPNGGTVVSGSLEQEIPSGEAAVPPEVVMEGMDLEWDGDYTNVQSDTVITGKWTPKKYTVHFVSDEGEFPDQDVVAEYGSPAIPPAWARDGYDLTWDADFSDVKSDLDIKAVWSRSEMDSAEIAEYAETRTVKVNVTLENGSASGSGFFIDDHGTFVTNYHVIEFGKSFSVECGNASYEVTTIIDFSPKYDLAIMQANLSGNDYFDLCTDVKKGEPVYAIGSALGTYRNTFTSGIISNLSHFIGKAECLQMDAAISSGNSGGPLVNKFGQVIGINSYGSSAGENLNFAIKVSMLDELAKDKNYSTNDFIQWWKGELAKSYRPTFLSNTNKYKNSIVNTYHDYVSDDCVFSMDSFYLSEVEGYSEGYDSNYWVYVYPYNAKKLTKYENYIKDLGFEYDSDVSNEYDLGYLSSYYSIAHDFYINILITDEKSEYEGKYIVIETVY